jgi:integrase
MPLIAPQIRAFAPAATPYKKTDERGLYLEVFPNGSKLWRLKYYVAGKEKRIALGAWPEVTLQKARHARDELRLRIANGEDPSLTRKRDKATAKISAANTFESVAREYIEEKMVGEGRAEGTLLKARWFLDLLKPAIGSMPISDVDPQMMLAPLKKLEARGNRETAKKCRSFASRVFRYGAATGRCTIDPTAILKGALLTPQARHYAAILEPYKLGELLRAIDSFECYPITKLALKIAPHIFVRPGEMRHGDWDEIDLDKAIWTIPAGKMKARRTHAVPLSRQVVELFKELKDVSGGKGYMFPAFHTRLRPMSENTINAALGNERAKPLAFLPGSPCDPASNGTLARRDADGWRARTRNVGVGCRATARHCSPSARAPCAHPARREARVLAGQDRRRRTLRSAQRGTECDH